MVHQADPGGWRAFHRPIAEPGAGEYGLYPVAKEKRLSGLDLSRELGGKNEKFVVGKMNARFSIAWR